MIVPLLCSEDPLSTRFRRFWDTCWLRNSVCETGHDLATPVLSPVSCMFQGRFIRGVRARFCRVMLMFVRDTICMTFVRMLWFEQADNQRQQDAQQQGGGEFYAVVAMELDFGKDVGQ